MRISIKKREASKVLEGDDECSHELDLENPGAVSPKVKSIPYHEAL
jgi:hypothetical protein